MYSANDNIPIDPVLSAEQKKSLTTALVALAVVVRKAQSDGNRLGDDDIRALHGIGRILSTFVPQEEALRLFNELRNEAIAEQLNKQQDS